MAPRATPQRRSLAESDSEEAEDAAQTSSSSRKRARYSNNGHSTGLRDPPITNGLQDEALHAQTSSKKHQPGAIVRVKLENFVTYTAVEFFPGPNLNMVIGPNGTGKSTLVCAICIGLGWGPQYLGRAKEVSEFVKHGCQEATIEIELAKDGKKLKKNVVVRCLIRKEGNKTIYSVNGENKSKKATVEMARSLSIQIDNLCQFLPQDKVVEFAAMTPIELLRSTQRAVAEQEMIDTHEYLKEKRRDQKELNRRIGGDQDILSNLEGRQRLQQADVDRMREREELVKKIRYLEACRPFAQYRRAKVEHDESKAQKTNATEALKSLRARVEPSMRAVNAKDRYKKQCLAAANYRRKAVTKAEEYTVKLNTKFQSLVDQENELEAQKAAEKRGTQNYKNEIARRDNTIHRLDKFMESPPPEVDSKAYNEKIRDKMRAMDETGVRIRELQDIQQEATAKGREALAKINEANKDLEQLDSQIGKQNHKLEQMSRDTYQGWKWIQENQQEFEKPIFGPPLVECSVKDLKYVDLIEALFQRNMFLSFTVQTKNDFAKLSHILHERMRLSEINIKTISYDLDAFRAPLSPEEAGRYGFESWAIDHLQGPGPVLAMLCAELRLHETGVSLQDTSDRQFEMLQHTSISTWVTSKSLFKVTRRREYGPGATSTQVRPVRSARAWTNQPIDPTAKRVIEEKIQGWTEERSSTTTQYSECRVKIEAHRETFGNYKESMEAITKEKGDKQKAVNEYNFLPAQKAIEEGKRKDARTALQDIQDRLRKIRDKEDAYAMERARVALSYAQSVEGLRLAHNVLYEAEILSIEATSDHEVLLEGNQAVTDMIKSREEEVQSLEAELAEVREKNRRLLDQCHEVLREMKSDPEARAFFQANSEHTPDSLESEIASDQTRLELMREGSGGVIREFEQRQKKIDGLQSKLAEYRAAKTELDQAISTLQGEWEPKLDELVKHISDAFSFNMQQINCAGEVGVWKDEDFDQWSIQIRVKFRESEPMTVLDSHRQSGGERAVSTIFYLMSLQSLTRSPFRIVDEINQGMDPRNERLVHKRMVAIACGTERPSDDFENRFPDGVNDPNADVEDLTVNNTERQRQVSAGHNQPVNSSGSQYFLITPKLLHDLEYARGMQVLCIASGEFMPPEQDRVDFKKCIDLMKGLRAGQGTNGSLTNAGMGALAGMNGARVSLAAR